MRMENKVAIVTGGSLTTSGTGRRRGFPRSSADSCAQWRMQLRGPRPALLAGSG